MPTSRAQSIHRVRRDRRDDRYEAGRPTPIKRGSSGWVVGVGDDTCTVRVLGEDLFNVVPLGEMPPCGAICEVEARGDLLVIPVWFPGPEPLAYVSYNTNLAFYGPNTYVAWDGGQHVLGESNTNNARYYGINVPVTADGALFESGFGQTETSTSNAPYNFVSNFVRAGMVPVLQYYSSDSTYRLGILGISGTTVTTLSSLASPSQAFASADFLRCIVPWNDSEIWAYGNAGSTVHVWQTSIDGSGNLSPFVGGSTVVRTGPGQLHNPIIFSQHLAIDPHLSLWTRTDPLTVRNPDTYIPASGGCPVNLDFGFFAGAADGDLYCIRRLTNSNYTHVAHLRCTSLDGTTGWSVVETWPIPAGITRIAAGMTGRGKVVVYVDDGTTVRSFYDVFGMDEEFEAEGMVMDAGFTNFDVGPILPADLPSTQDAWLAGDSTSGTGGLMHLVVRGGCS